MTKAPVVKGNKNKVLPRKKQKFIKKKVTLLTPYCSYRPRISQEASAEFARRFATLPPLMAKKPVVQWSEIKNVARSERKAFRNGRHQRQPTNEEVRKHLIFGINRVMRHLEEKQLDAVLISSCVNPFILVDHVLDLCVLHSTPVLIVEGLREAVHSSLGVSTACMGILKGCKDETLREIAAQTENLWLLNQPPKGHAFQDRESQRNVQLVRAEPLQSVDVDVSTVENCHLTRLNSKQRAFTPTEKSAIQKDSMKLNFIPFSSQGSNETSVTYNGMGIAKVNRRTGGKKQNKEKPISHWQSVRKAQKLK